MDQRRGRITEDYSKIQRRTHNGSPIDEDDGGRNASDRKSMYVYFCLGGVASGIILVTGAGCQDDR